MYRVAIERMQDRVCIVTGANAGIGRATAEHLAARGASVVMVCRDEERGAEARDAIVTTTRNERIELMLCDLASQRSIRRFVDKFTARHDQLHVLINNAGVTPRERQETEDGIELGFAVNVLAPFLLSNLLLDQLLDNAPARIVNLVGKSHRKGSIAFDDLMSERSFHPWKANKQQQLARALLTFQLARRLSSTRVTANGVHPGAVLTEAQKKLPWYVRLLIHTILRPAYVKPPKGAMPVVMLASDPSLADFNGSYFEGMRQRPASDAAYDYEAALQLWQECERLTEPDRHLLHVPLQPQVAVQDLASTLRSP